MSGQEPGILFVYFAAAILLTVPVSLILVWFYRRAVSKAMRLAAAGGDTAAQADLAAPAQDAGPLLEAAQASHVEQRMRLRVACVYLAATAAAAAVWTVIFCQDPATKFNSTLWLGVWLAFCWPVVPTLTVLLALERRQALWIAAGYVFSALAVMLIWSGYLRVALGRTNVSPLGNARGFLALLALEAWPPALVILVASRRRIRGVSPMLLAGLLVFTFSSVAVNAIFVRLADVGGFRNTLLVFGSGSLDWWFMVATVPVGYAGWRLLLLLNALFERKAFSDVQLLVDSFWLIIAFILSVQFASSFGWLGLWGLAGFAVYRAVAAAGLAAWRPAREPPVRLLMLRVFGYRSRAQRLFDSVAQHWRFRGSIKLIAGPDLAARTMHPAATLALAGATLRSRFVQGAADLQERLAHTDETRDPDGRYRVAEFYCHQNTWTGALIGLLGASDAVLMDLRGFSEGHSGCIYELRQLAAFGRLDNTVFIVDHTTDVELLESTIAAQPGPGFRAVRDLHIERVDSDSARERERVYRVLQRAAAGTPRG